MYRISKNIRKYSPTPIVEVLVDDNGKETEKIIAVVLQHSKKEGDLLSEKIVKLLNESI